MTAPAPAVPLPVVDAEPMQCDYCAAGLTAVTDPRDGRLFYVHAFSGAVRCAYRLFGGTPQVATPIPVGKYATAHYAKAGA